MKNITLFLFLVLPFYGFNQLPKQWEGHYIGELKSENSGGNSANYHMELIVNSLTDSTYNWIIIYGEDSLRQERKYFLIDKGNNQFDIDEDNSILLSCNLIKNQFISVFEVQGNLIHVVYTFKKRKVCFDLTMSSNRSETGNGDEETPLVYSYETSTVQKAILKRVKN